MSPHAIGDAPCEIDCTDQLTELRHAFPWSKHKPCDFPPAFRLPLLYVLAYAQKADHPLGSMLSASVTRPITILDYVADWLPLDLFQLVDELEQIKLCVGKKRKHKHGEQLARELQLAWHSNPQMPQPQPDLD